MIFKVWHSGEGVNRDSIHVEWVKPQAYHMDHDYAYNKAIMGRPIPEGIRVPLLTKAKKSKLVDYISSASIDSSFMIISEKIINIFGDIELAQHTLVDIDIDNIIYFGLHFEEISTAELIHWETAKFYIRTGLNHDRSVLYYFSNYEAYRKSSKQLMINSVGRSSYNISCIQFNEPEYDLFYSISPVFGIFCSQKFVDLVEARKITGFKFEPITERYPVIGMVEYR